MLSRVCQVLCAALVCLALGGYTACAFLVCTPHMVIESTRGGTALGASSSSSSRASFLRKALTTTLTTATLASAVAAQADEYGPGPGPPKLEKNPGDVCVRRALNGICEEYGMAPQPAVAEEDEAAKTLREKAEKAKAVSKIDGADTSDLITKLKKQTEDNKAKNNADIEQKTFLNNQAGEFGPFSRYVPVKHPNSADYELVMIRDLGRLQDEGKIDKSGKYFVE